MFAPSPSRFSDLPLALIGAILCLKLLERPMYHQRKWKKDTHLKKFSSWKLTRPPTFGHELHYPFCETRTSPALAIIVARPPSCRSPRGQFLYIWSKNYWKNIPCGLSTLYKTLEERTVAGFWQVDGISSSISKGRDVPLSLCPRTKEFSCPGVPLSRDKGRSKCPGTNPSVPGRPGTKSPS